MKWLAHPRRYRQLGQSSQNMASQIELVKHHLLNGFFMTHTALKLSGLAAGLLLLQACAYRTDI